MSKRVVAALVGLVLVALAPLTAQNRDRFTARLGWVPITGAERANVTGKGSVVTTLSGSKLAITGSFEGLAAPATIGRLHEGVAKGARGHAFADLMVTKATSGTIAGSVDLTPAQIGALKEGHVYVQLHSEKGVAPDGSSLWGWLLRASN
jgi:hypothetical protein